MDATPRGGGPGFVKVADERTLLLPDRPGNNRLDALSNLTEHPEIGLLFMIPGVDETLRVNGASSCGRTPIWPSRSESAGGRRPSCCASRVKEAYLHCAKALMRSRLWSAEAQIDRSELPTLGEMLRDQTGSGAAESQAAMVARYHQELY